RQPYAHSARRARDDPVQWPPGRRGQRGPVGGDASLDSRSLVHAGEPGSGGEHYGVRWGPRAVVRWHDTLLPLEPAWRGRGERLVCDDARPASRAGRGRGRWGGEAAEEKDSHGQA